MSVHFVPKGHHSVAPYFVVRNIRDFIDFLELAFGAETLRKMVRPDGRVQHCEIKIGDSIIMAGQREDAVKLTTHLFLEDVDAAYARCLKAGGKSLYAPVTQPYGDRGAGVEDPAGNTWWISTHVEDVSDEEIERRMAKA